MDKAGLTDRLIEEFDCSRSEARSVSDKVAKYVRDRETSDFTEKMKDPNYIPEMLQKNATNGNIITRWNQWIGQFTKDSLYQIS